MKKQTLAIALLSALLLSGCSEISYKEPAVTVAATTAAPFTTTTAPTTKAENETTTTVKTTAITTVTTTATTTTTPETTTEATTTTVLTTTTTPEATTSAVPETKAAAVNADDYYYNVLGDNGILVSWQDGHYRGLMPCWGTYGYCDKYISAVNTFAKKLPDVNVYSMVVPTSVEFYLPAENNGFTGSQKNKIDYIAEALKNVTAIDAYSALAAHTDEEIYSRTDHHWFPLGGYYAAAAFAEQAGVPFADISDYKKVKLGGYVGSLYNYSKDLNLKGDPETFALYIPQNETETTYYDINFKNGYSSDLIIAPDASAYYCSFLGSDDRIAKVTTDAENDRTLVIFKESYGNALVPFLTSSFKNIYVCDIRYFNPNAVDFCKEVGATDLLFATCTFTPAGVNCKYMNVILNN